MERCRACKSILSDIGNVYFPRFYCLNSKCRNGYSMVDLYIGTFIDNKGFKKELQMKCPQPYMSFIERSGVGDLSMKEGISTPDELPVDNKVSFERWGRDEIEYKVNDKDKKITRIHYIEYRQLSKKT